MKSRHFLAFLISFLALTGIAHAQVTNPNYWTINTASSTITPKISNLQIPCANIAGGCTAGAVSTTINGVVGPNFSFSVVSTSSPSSVTTSSAQVFLNLLRYASSSDITVFPTGTIIFANHNISQFTNDSGYLTSSTGVTSFNAQTGAATYTDKAGTGLSVTTSTTSSTLTLNINNGSVQNCAAGQNVNSLSATGTITCVVTVQSIAGVSTSTIAISGTSNEVNIATTTNSITLSTPQAIGTGSSPAFSGITITNNVTSTSFSANSATNSTIDYINGVWNVPANYATVGFAGSSTLTDLGAIANYAYLANQATQSSTVIKVTSLPQFVLYATPILFGTNGQYVDLECNPGQVLELNATSGVAITYNEGTGIPSSSHLPHDGGHNCIFATASTTASTTDILIGGTNGESQLTLTNFGAINANVGWNTAANTYMLALYNPEAQKDGQDWVGNTASNSGESVKLYGANFVDPANASASNCLYLGPSAYASFEVYGGSIDDCQFTIAAGNLGVNLYGPHMENAFPTGYPAYDEINELSAANGASSVTGWGITFYQDGTSTAAGAPGEYVNAGSNFTCYSCSFNRTSGATTTPKAVNNTNSSSNANIMMCYTDNQNAGTAFTKLIAGNTNPTNIQSGCFGSQANSWLYGWSMSNGNLFQAYDGGNPVLTVNANGNLNVGSGNSATTTLYTTGSQGGSANISSLSNTITTTFGKYQILTPTTNVTDTLPTINLSQGDDILFFNRGSHSEQLVASTTAPDYLWLVGTNATSAVFTLNQGSSTELYNDGTYWDQLWVK